MAATPDSIYEAARDAFVIDADFHIDPPGTALLPYIDDDRIRSKMQASSPPNLPTGYPPSSSTWHAGYATAEGGSGLDSQGKAVDGEDVVAVMETVGIDMPLVTPGLNPLPSSQYPRLKDAICRAYNDYVLDVVAPAHEDIKVQIALPQWNPEAAAAELDRIGDEADVAGAYGWFGPYRLLGSDEYDPVFERLEALGLPWTLHGSSGFRPRYDLPGDSLRSWIEALGVVWPTQAMLFTTNMIVTGVFDSFPDLKIVIEEGGVNWVPFMAYRLDEFYHDHPEDVQLAERLFDRGQRYLDRDPSEYLYENFFFATQPISRPPEPGHFRAMLEMCRAADTFVFSSDWPHHTIDTPNWLFDGSVDDDLRERILHGNAERAYRVGR